MYTKSVFFIWTDQKVKLLTAQRAIAEYILGWMVKGFQGRDKHPVRIWYSYCIPCGNSPVCWKSNNIDFKLIYSDKDKKKQSTHKKECINYTHDKTISIDCLDIRIFLLQGLNPLLKLGFCRCPWYVNNGSFLIESFFLCTRSWSFYACDKK